MSSRNLILILATSGFASTFSGSRGRADGRGHRPGPDSTPQTIALLSAAFALPYAFIQPDPGADRRCARQGAGHEGGAPDPLPGARRLVLRAQCRRTLFALRIIAGAAAGGAIPLSIALIGDRVPMAQAPGGAQPLSRGGHRRPARRFVACRAAGGTRSAGAGSSACPTVMVVLRARRHRSSAFAARCPGGKFDLSQRAPALSRHPLEPARARRCSPRLRRGASRFSASSLTSRRCSRSAAGADAAEAGFAIGGFASAGLIYSAAGDLDAPAPRHRPAC